MKYLNAKRSRGPHLHTHISRVYVGTTFPTFSFSFPSKPFNSTKVYQIFNCFSIVLDIERRYGFKLV